MIFHRYGALIHVIREKHQHERSKIASKKSRNLVNRGEKKFCKWVCCLQIFAQPKSSREEPNQPLGGWFKRWLDGRLKRSVSLTAEFSKLVLVTTPCLMSFAQGRTHTDFKSRKIIPSTPKTTTPSTRSALADFFDSSPLKTASVG